MEPRTIAIGLIAVVAAFGAAFGISSSGGGGKTATAGAGTKAETIKVAAPAAVAGVEVGGTLPALKAEKKAKKKAAKKPSTTSNTLGPVDEQLDDRDAAPTTQQPTTPAADRRSSPTTQQPSTPKPSTPKPNNDGPVSGGGEDG